MNTAECFLFLYFVVVLTYKQRLERIVVINLLVFNILILDILHRICFYIGLLTVINEAFFHYMTGLFQLVLYEISPSLSYSPKNKNVFRR